MNVNNLKFRTIRNSETKFQISRSDNSFVSYKLQELQWQLPEGSTDNIIQTVPFKKGRQFNKLDFNWHGKL